MDQSFNAGCWCRVGRDGRKSAQGPQKCGIGLRSGAGVDGTARIPFEDLLEGAALSALRGIGVPERCLVSFFCVISAGACFVFWILFRYWLVSSSARGQVPCS